MCAHSTDGMAHSVMTSVECAEDKKESLTLRKSEQNDAQDKKYGQTLTSCFKPSLSTYHFHGL